MSGSSRSWSRADRFDFSEFGFEQLPKPESQVGVGAGIVARRDDGHFVERNLVLALAGELVVPCHWQVQELDRERIEGMRTTPGIEQVARQHRVEVKASEYDSGAPQHQQVVLCVVRGLSDLRVGEQRAQRLHLRRTGSAEGSSLRVARRRGSARQCWPAAALSAGLRRAPKRQIALRGLPRADARTEDRTTSPGRDRDRDAHEVRAQAV